MPLGQRRIYILLKKRIQYSPKAYTFLLAMNIPMPLWPLTGNL